MAKRLINLREGIFRYITQSAKPHYGPGAYVVWSSCHKPTPITKFTVTNPGTSFARVTAITPKFVETFKFINPCAGEEE